MKFKCGPNEDEIIAKEQSRKLDAIAKTVWHDWFAWYPVSVGAGDCRWLETVERRCRIYGNLDEYYMLSDWTYRERGSDGDGYCY